MKILKVCKYLLIIDHHKSAEQALRNIPDRNKIFNMSESGASLTWKYFYENDDLSAPMPLLVQYVRDRDLWLNQMPDHLKFVAWFHKLSMEFEIYNLYFDDNLLQKSITDAGDVAVAMDEYFISQCVNSARPPKFVQLPDKRFAFVSYVNSTVFPSEIGSRLLSKYQHCDFSAVYYTERGTKFSLRSDNSKMDVSIIAKSFNGGGHPNASGLYLNHITNVLPCFTIDDSGNTYLKLFENINDRIRFAQIGPFRVVYLMYDLHRHALGKYLLQGVRIPDDIEQQKCHNFGSEVDKVDIAAIYKYDALTDITSYKFSFKVSDEMIQQFADIIGAVNDVRKSVKFPGKRFTL